MVHSTFTLLISYNLVFTVKMATPQKLQQFSPPAYLTDIKPENVKAWSDTISGWMDDEIAGRVPGRSPLKQFFNGTETAYVQSADHVNITWFGFPKKVNRPPEHFMTQADSIKVTGNSDEQRWKKAEATLTKRSTITNRCSASISVPSAQPSA